MIPGRTRYSPLIGRQHELNLARRQLEHVLEHKGGVLIIAGEAGIGKSRLAAKTASFAEAQGLIVNQGQCFEQDQWLPYALFLDLVRTSIAGHSATEVTELLGHAAAELVKLVPELALLLEHVTPTTSLDPQTDRHRFARAFIGFATRLSLSRPALVILEDLHWSDDLSLDVIHGLARATTSCPLLLLLTYRSDEAHPSLQHLLAGLERERLAIEVRLAPLDPAEVDTLIRTVFGQEQPIRRDFLDAVTTLTDGNPFFIEELLGSLVATGDIFRRGSIWDRFPLHELRIPRTVQDAVQRRAKSLSPAARALLVPAAVAGRRFDFALLQQITRHDESTLLGLIKELVVAQFVVEEAPDQFAFRHALTREAMLIGLLTRERRALHRSIATLLEHQDSESDVAIAVLAYHFFEAGNWPKALAYAERAGARALAMHAPRTALEHFTHALQASDALGLAAPAKLYRARGEAHSVLGAFEAAREDYEAALAAARAVSDRTEEWQALINLGFLWAARDYARVQPYLEQALDLARTLGEPLLIARSLNRVANWLVNVGRPREALPLHDEALTIFETAADGHGIAETMDLLGLAAAHSGDIGRAIDCYERAAVLYREQDDRMGLVSALVMLAEIGTEHPGASIVLPTVSPTRTLSRAEEAVAIARSLDWRSGEAYALLGLAYCLTGQGAYGQALDAARTGLAIAVDIEHQQWMVAGYVTIAGLYLELFAPALALQPLDQAQVIADATGSAYWLGLVTAIRAFVFWMQGDLEQTQAQLRLLPDFEDSALNPIQLFAIRGQIELALAAGYPEKALAIVDACMIAVDRTAATNQIASNILLVRGEALSRLGKNVEAEAVCHSVVKTAGERGTWPVLWRAHAALGRLAYADGRRAEAAAEYDAARAIIERLAAGIPDEPETALNGTTLRAHFVAATATFLPRPRPPTRLRAAKEAYAGLTAREREVAVLVASGKTNREIAALLVVGERTVQTHIGNIFAKLGCSSRAQIAAWAVEQGLATTA